MNKDPLFLGSPLSLDQGYVLKSTTLSTMNAQARPSVQRVTGLMVLPSGTTVPAGAFRPGSSSLNKLISHTTGDAASVASLFPTLAETAGSDPFATIIDWLRRPISMTMLYGDHGRRHYASDNMPSSSGYLGNANGWASQMTVAAQKMCTNGLSAAEKTSMRDAFIQAGIDVYDRIETYPDERWMEGGGLQVGYKLPLVMAAMFLNDTGMKTRAADLLRFHEDRQVFVIQAGDVGATPTSLGSGRGETVPYVTGDIGKPEWAEQATRQPIRNTRDLSGTIGGTYRAINSSYQMGVSTMAALVPEFRTIWGSTTIFDYTDLRQNWMLAQTSPNNPAVFNANMFTTYRDQFGPARTFGPGDGSNTW